MLLRFKSASRPSSISTFNCGFICEHLLFVQYKTKTKKVCRFHNILSSIFKFYKTKNLHKFLKFWSFINLPWGHENLGPICSSVLSFIGYKQTDKHQNRQTDKLSLYIDLRSVVTALHKKKTRKIKPSFFYDKTIWQWTLAMDA